MIEFRGQGFRIFRRPCLFSALFYVFRCFFDIFAHSTAAGEEKPPAAVLCVFVHKKLSFDFEGNRLFLPGCRLPMTPYRSAMTVIVCFWGNRCFSVCWRTFWRSFYAYRHLCMQVEFVHRNGADE